MGAMGILRFGRCRRPWFGCGRLTLNFNPDWKFLKADPAGAFENAFDNRGWTNVSTPHAFNGTDTFDDWSLSGHRGEQNQWSGRTWYRKSFTPSDTSLLVDGKPMRIFQHRAQADESLTLSANAEDAKHKTCNMYLMFFSAAERPRAAQTDDHSQ